VHSIAEPVPPSLVGGDGTAPPDLGDKQRLAFVLWNGNLGGAEVFSVGLARQMRKLGREVTLVFIENPRPLVARLSGDGPVPYRSLGFDHGRDILRHPRRYAAEVSRAGPDGALLVTCGFMGAALRAGGYGGPLVAVEHGDVLEAQFQSKRKRALRWLGRVSGTWADDIEVAVSDFVLERLREQPHSGPARRIYNGLDPSQFVPVNSSGGRTDGECIVAFAGRLVYGKGADYLIKAIARISSTQNIRLVIAGDGPERSRLESLTYSLDVSHIVDFLGLRHDMPAFWRSCDIAAVPSAEFTESCPMTTLEAMASGKPVVATHNGGLPELVIDQETGIVVPSHDEVALANALAVYASNKKLRISHGTAGRARVMGYFHINKCAHAYLDLFAELARQQN
jgi:glycosyltransferase involved in cell wall biosynthesis